jgi:hypothetical protein
VILTAAVLVLQLLLVLLLLLLLVVVVVPVLSVLLQLRLGGTTGTPLYCDTATIRAALSNERFSLVIALLYPRLHELAQ